MVGVSYMSYELRYIFEIVVYHITMERGKKLVRASYSGPVIVFYVG